MPGRYLIFAEQPTAVQLHQAFGISEILTRTQAVADLDTELNAALARISDSATRETLQLLQRRMDLAMAPPPPQQYPDPIEVTLSAEGIGIESADQIPVGHYLAVYLLLDGVHPFVACGQVRWSETTTTGRFRCGAEFAALTTEQARRLARFVLRRSRLTVAA